MKNKYVFFATMLVLLGGIGFLITSILGKMPKDGQKGEVQLVTSFYPVYIAALNITDGITGVTVTNLTEPDIGCLHDYQISTSDMVLLGDADAFLINGGGMESFMHDVTEQHPNLSVIDLGEGYDGEPGNAHFWLDLAGYEYQLDRLTEQLSSLNPEFKAEYETNLESYKIELDQLEISAESIKSKVSGNQVILLHEGFEYLAGMLGLEAPIILDLDEETGHSAGQLSNVIQEAKEKNLEFIFSDRQNGAETTDLIASEIQGRVYELDSLTQGSDDKNAYVTAMKNNLDTIEAALAP